MGFLERLFRQASVPNSTDSQPTWSPHPDGLSWDSVATNSGKELFDFLQEEQLGSEMAGAFLLPWADCYRILSNEHTQGLGQLLAIPEVLEGWAPELRAIGSLSDPGFRIDVVNWCNNQTGLATDFRRVGSLVTTGGDWKLVPEPCHRLLHSLSLFSGCTSSQERTRTWGRVRGLATEAGAILDGYLKSTIILTPDLIRFVLDSSSSGEMKVEPTFEGAPPAWIQQFDKRNSIPERIDLTGPNSELIQVFLTTEIRDVLQSIKRQFPTRHLRGDLGRQFLRNPWSVLPSGSESVVTPESVESEWERADIGTFSMKWKVLEQEGKISGVQLHLLSISSVPGKLDSILFLERTDFIELCHLVEASIKDRQPDYFFRGFQIEIDPNTLADLPIWKDLLERWNDQLESSLELREKEQPDQESFAPQTEWIHEAQPGTAISAEDGQSQSRPASAESVRYGVKGIQSAGALPLPVQSQVPWKIPSSLACGIELRPYQMEGVRWLHERFPSSAQGSSGAILADDMGLGKTLQCLTFLASVFEMDPLCAPALVVAPVSLLDNWKNEIGTFLASGTLRVLRLHGSELNNRTCSTKTLDPVLHSKGIEKCLEPQWREGFHVVLTSYEVLREYEISLACLRWSVVILDEAQKIKNPTALVTRAARAIPSRFRIACTGTPVENSLRDLWSLFQFIQPGFLGSLTEFSQTYRKPIEAKTNEEKAQVEVLRSLISPWILRRTKSSVAKDLPPKRDASELDSELKSIPLTPAQINLCDRTASVYAGCAKGSPIQARLALFKALHESRMICALAKSKPDGIDANSWQVVPKGKWLLNALKFIRARDEKVLIFSEYREIQLQLSCWIHDQLGIRPEILNGSTATSGAEGRQSRIDAFSRSSGFAILILGTKALGSGVNIQSANHVIHYTRSWNPAIEDQATDRAYRIGQKREVFVYTPTSTHPKATWKTFEERLDSLLARKRILAQDILNGSISDEDGLEELMPQ